MLGTVMLTAIVGNFMPSVETVGAVSSINFAKVVKRIKVEQTVDTVLSEAPMQEKYKQELKEAVVSASLRYDVEPTLILAVIYTESSFKRKAVSHVGARGMMQLMPRTGMWLAEREGFDISSPEDLFNIQLNVELGTVYLAELIERFKRLDHALAAYNAGPTGARKILRSERAESFLSGYPTKVLSTKRRFDSL